jgi:pSer/pThr/pTyr-binding forkhead associated (FHA) protein
MTQEIILLQQPSAKGAVGRKLEPGVHIVGRSVQCDIVLRDASVSRRHAELRVDNSILTVRDLGSRNGTFVGETPIETRQVKFGERIRFGCVCLVVRQYAACDVEQELETLDAEDIEESPRSLSTAFGLSLSAAQARVFELLLGGLSEKQVAGKLELSRHTVHTHVRQIYRVLKVKSRAELLAHFVQQPSDPAQSHI